LPSLLACGNGLARRRVQRAVKRAKTKKCACNFAIFPRMAGHRHAPEAATPRVLIA
jgi:hypothetical protein